MTTKVRLKQLSDEVLDLLGGGGALSKEIISNAECGAAPVGTTFSAGETLQQVMEKLLRKDIIPSISTLFSGSGLKEIGTTVNGSTITLDITNLSSVTVPIKEINFYEGSTLLEKQIFQDGVSKYTYTYNKIISSTLTLKAEVVYNSTSKVSNTGTFTFVYASYNGVTNLATLNDVTANNLIQVFNKTIKNSKAYTWNDITVDDERFCYIYPKSFGTLTAIKDGNGFNQNDSYTRLELNLTSPVNGDIVPYYVYLLTDATTGTGFTQIYQ